MGRAHKPISVRGVVRVGRHAVDALERQHGAQAIRPSRAALVESEGVTGEVYSAQALKPCGALCLG